jgi:surfactin synthase thioesterase subunit
VVPVEVANRLRFTTLRQLVDDVNGQLRSSLDQPHMFFGHSFGALLAYRLACVRAAQGSRRGRAVFSSPRTAHRIFRRHCMSWICSTTTSSRRSCPTWAGCLRN